MREDYSGGKHCNDCQHEHPRAGVPYTFEVQDPFTMYNRGPSPPHTYCLTQVYGSC